MTTLIPLYPFPPLAGGDVRTVAVSTGRIES